MRNSSTSSRPDLGACPHGLGPRSPVLLGALLAGCVAMGCSNRDDTRTLEPVVLGMTADMAPAYMSDEAEYYEVKLPVQFPVMTPTAAESAALGGGVAPFPSEPYIKKGDIDVQVTWTITNLDANTHEVNLLVDPWNEFGRYWPGQAVIDEEELLPNLSGIQSFFPLPGTDSDEESRVTGTFTLEDMQELAIDFSTVMNIIQVVPPPADDQEGTGPVNLVNHAFSFRNQSSNDPLVDQYIPGMIAGLTGFDIGLRTASPANIALEIVVEVTDRGNNKVAEEADFDCLQGVCQWTGKPNRGLLEPPTAFITAGM